MSTDKKYIYVMQCKEYVKFGVSRSPEIRIKELQTGNPFKITLLLQVLYDNHFNIEKTIHNYFNDNRKIGEWFIIDDKIKNFVKYLKNIEYNTGDNLNDN